MKVSNHLHSSVTNYSLKKFSLYTLTNIVLLTVALFGGESRGNAQVPNLEPIPPTQQSQAAPSLQLPPSQPPAETAYTLGAGDRLRMDIFDVPEYSGEYQVLADGSITLPIVGSIPIGQLTIDQATQRISSAYQPFIKRPLVTLSLLQARPLKIAVAGEINRPGSYTIPLTEGKFPTLTEVVQLAGGMTVASDIRNVLLYRSGQGQPFSVDLWALLEQGNLGQDPSLRDGDRIVVVPVSNVNPQESRRVATSNLVPEESAPVRVAIVGEVPRPGSYILEAQGIGEPVTITQAIQEAGGALPFADIGQIQVRRLTNFGTPQSISLNLWDLLQRGDVSQDLVLNDGDTIVIPVATEPNVNQSRLVAGASFGTQTTEPFNVAIVGEVYRPGTHTVTPGSVTDPVTLTKAIQEAGGIRPTANIREIEVRRPTRDGQGQAIKVNLWDLLQAGDLKQDVILQEGDEIFIAKATDPQPAELAALQTATFAPDEINVSVVGEVEQPGTYQLRPGTPLSEAIFTAGGMDQVRAKKTGVDLMRLNPDGTVSPRRIQIDFSAPVNEETNPLVQNGDVVVVPRNGFAGAADAFRTFLQPVESFFNIFNPIDRFRRFVD